MDVHLPYGDRGGVPEASSDERGDRQSEGLGGTRAITDVRRRFAQLGTAVLVGGLLVRLADQRMHAVHPEAVSPELLHIPPVVLQTPPTPTPTPVPVQRRPWRGAAAPNHVLAHPSSLDHALAESLGLTWRTVEAPRLIATLRREAEAWGEELDLPLLLSIVASETAGRILAISPTGAVGPYQLMPAEALHDPSAPVCISEDDARGLRAYLTKKPLSDALRIVRLLRAPGSTPDVARARACRQLGVAMSVRRDGFDDLLRLAPYARDGFMEESERIDTVNAALLMELDRLLSLGANDETLEQFSADLRRDYLARLDEQRSAWARATATLTKRRDAMLRRLPRSNDQYRTAEALAQLDVRFSPSAAFPLFIATLERKRQDAATLRALLEDETEPLPVPDPLQIRLYNAGLGTLARREIGLLESRENDEYERRVLRLVETLNGELKRLRLEP